MNTIKMHHTELICPYCASILYDFVEAGESHEASSYIECGECNGLFHVVYDATNGNVLQYCKREEK